MRDTRDKLQEVAQSVSVILPPFTGFVVMAFDFNQAPGSSRLEYVSNANREDVLKAMREFIDKNERENIFGKHA